MHKSMRANMRKTSTSINGDGVKCAHKPQNISLIHQPRAPNLLRLNGNVPKVTHKLFAGKTQSKGLARAFDECFSAKQLPTIRDRTWNRYIYIYILFMSNTFLCEQSARARFPHLAIDCASHQNFVKRKRIYKYSLSSLIHPHKPRASVSSIAFLLRNKTYQKPANLSHLRFLQVPYSILVAERRKSKRKTDAAAHQMHVTAKVLRAGNRARPHQIKKWVI